MGYLNLYLFILHEVESAVYNLQMIYLEALTLTDESFLPHSYSEHLNVYKYNTTCMHITNVSMYNYIVGCYASINGQAELHVTPVLAIVHCLLKHTV